MSWVAAVVTSVVVFNYYDGDDIDNEIGYDDEDNDDDNYNDTECIFIE